MISTSRAILSIRICFAFSTGRAFVENSPCTINSFPSTFRFNCCPLLDGKYCPVTSISVGSPATHSPFTNCPDWIVTIALCEYRLADCEDFLDNVVLPGRGLEGTEDSKTIDIQKQKLVAADLYSMVGGLPDFTENKLSITYPRSWYDATAKRLYREGGEPEKAELIGNKIEVPKGRARNRW